MPNPSLLFLYGNDEYAMARRLESLQAAFDPGGMNTTRLDAHTASQEELNSAVNAMPFLGEKRLVFLENPSGRSSLPTERDQFIRFLLAAPPSTLVVMHEPVEGRDIKKHWLVKRAEKGEFQAEVFTMPHSGEMTGWIIREARSMDSSIEPAAAARLAEMVGENTRQAKQELIKLLTYVHESRPVTLRDVEAVSVTSAQASIFALVDALATGDGKKAQKLLHALLEEEDAMALWGMVIRQFRLLLQAREVLDGRGSLLDAQKSIPEAQYSVQKAYQQAGRFTMQALEKIYHRLLEMDEGNKTGAMPLDAALDAFVVELVHH